MGDNQYGGDLWDKSNAEVEIFETPGKDLDFD